MNGQPIGSAQDLQRATDLATQTRELDLYHERLVSELKRLDDHRAIIGARLRCLITGEPAHLAAEVR